IDYTRKDFTTSGKQYDLILDLAAYRSAFDYPRALTPSGSYWAVGGSAATLLQIVLRGPGIKRKTGKKIGLLAVRPNRKDLALMAELCAAGKVSPAIDRQYALSQAPEALRYVGEGRVKGKVIIRVDQADAT